MTAVCLLLLTLPAAPTAQATAKITTKGEPFVGQRVALQVEVLSPTRFDSAVSFDVPAIPGVVVFKPKDSAELVTDRTIGDDTYTVQMHEFAVYAQRPGRVMIPPITARFDATGPPGKLATPERATTPTVEFTARLPPGAEGLGTVLATKELTVEEKWSPEPKDAKLGDAFTRTVTMTITDVPGMVLPAIPWAPIPGLGIYPKGPATEDQINRGEITGKRVETVVYVCEEPGPVTLPAQTLTWWDLGESKLQRVTLPSRTFEVAGASASSATNTPSPETPSARPWWHLVVLYVLGAVFIFVIWWASSPVFLGSEADLFARFQDACRGNDAPSAYRALLAWVDRLLPDAPEPRLDELVARSGDPDLAARLADLEAALYPRPGALEHVPAGWSGRDLERSAERARRVLRRSSSTPRTGQLEPLNPA